jgi:hypothetical protein
MTPEFIKELKNKIWQNADKDPSLNIYAILDAARDERIYAKLISSEFQYFCLFRGEKTQELSLVAPYLVPLNRDDPFTQWLFEFGWGNSWGIFIESTTKIHTLKRHFQELVSVYDDAGKPLSFRFYDPRVLRIYLPTCTQSELLEVFGPVILYYVEDEDPNEMVGYASAKGSLVVQRINLAISRI